MRSRKWTVVTVVVSCAVLLAIWSLLGPAVPSKDIRNDQANEVSPSAREGRRVQPIIDGFSPPIARKHYQALPEQELTREDMEKRVASAIDVLHSLSASAWLRASFIVAQHGDSDQATEAIINLIENQVERTADNTDFLKGRSKRQIAQTQGTDYMRRLSVLTPLGLTGTERAEQFLLATYENPGVVEPNRKHRMLFDRQSPIGNTLTSPASIDLITWRCAAMGLILLDEQKYGTMIEDEFEQLKPLVLRVESGDGGQLTADDYIQRNKYGVLLDVLIARDVMHERGTFTVEYMIDVQAQVDAFQRYARKYESFPDGQGPENWFVIVN